MMNVTAFLTFAILILEATAYGSVPKRAPAGLRSTFPTSTNWEITPLKSYQAKIHLAFEKNPNFWGTWRLSNEIISIQTSKRRSFKHQPAQRVGTMTFAKGNIIFVHSVPTGTKTELRFVKIPYMKKEKTFVAKNKTTLDELELFDVFGVKIEEALQEKGGIVEKHFSLQEGMVDFSDLTCKRERNKYNCTLQLEIKIPDLKRATRYKPRSLTYEET